MSSALLSRFDLVFILLDRPDEEMDSLLSEHVLSLHARGRRGQGQPSAAARAGHRSGAGQRGAATFQARGDGTGILTATARRNAEVRVLHSDKGWGGGGGGHLTLIVNMCYMCCVASTPGPLTFDLKLEGLVLDGM